MKKRPLSEKEQLIYTIIQYASPTLHHKKVASLINFKDAAMPLHSLWQKYRQDIMSLLNIACFEIKVSKDRSLVLFYDPFMLQHKLQCTKHQDFLRKFGYSSFTVSQALNHLKSRFSHACPHEIGIFLGYPLEDVKCFVNCDQRSCLAIGYWKVYENLESAQKTFKLYDDIKAGFLSRIDQGILPSESLYTY